MTASEFAALVRQEVGEARGQGRAVPVFVSPPAGGMDRSVRRRPDGVLVVAVRYRDRDEDAVLADIRAGIEAAARLGV